MAEGEFALVKEHLGAIDNTPAVSRGSLITDNVLNFMRTDLAVLQRDENALRQYAPLAAESAARDGHVLFQASAQRALGVLRRLTGDYVAAEDHLHQALQVFEDLETRWQLGRTLVELGELAIARTDITQARDYYAKAVEAFDAMGAVPDMMRAKAALEALN
jgi:tetratricopeptide (TPR) repeat protein